MSRSQVRIAVTGMGAITPFGGTQETLNAVFEGRSAITSLPPQFSMCPTHIGGFAAHFDLQDYFDPREAKRHTSRTERVTQLALAAAKQALVSAALLQGDGMLPSHLQTKTGIVMGSGSGSLLLITALGADIKWVQDASDEEDRQRRFQELVKKHLNSAVSGLSDASSFYPAMVFKAQGPSACVVKACATGAGAIELAAEKIRAGIVPVMIAGSTEELSPGTSLIFSSYARRGALSLNNGDPQGASRPFDKNHDGFVPAEGAGVLVLEEMEHARLRKVPILAELVGAGETTDASHLTDPDTASQTRCMWIAATNAGLRIPDKSQLLFKAHGTSTVAGDASELNAIKLLLKALEYDPEHVVLTAPKSMLGHMLGAAGSVEAIIAIEALTRQLAPPTINLQDPIPETLVCEKTHEHGDECHLVIPRRPTPIRTLYALCNSFGFGGQNVSLVFQKVL